MTQEEAQMYIAEIADRQDIYIYHQQDWHCEGCGRPATRLFVRWLPGESAPVELCGGCATVYDKLEEFGRFRPQSIEA